MVPPHEFELECETAESASALRDSLNAIDGVEAYEALRKGGSIDASLIVEIVVASVAALTAMIPVIVATLSALGFKNIKVAGKVTVLNAVSVEAAIEANRDSAAKAPQ